MAPMYLLNRMDVIQYRQVVLGGVENCSPILVPYLPDAIRRGHCFRMNQTEMCTGWKVRGRVSPVFQATRHRRWLCTLRVQLHQEIKIRYRRRAFWLLYQSKQLNNDTLRLIMDYL